MSGNSVFAAGSTAFITGGASGIGLAIASLCRSKSMNVFIADRNVEALEAAKFQLSKTSGTSSPEIAIAELDVSQSEAWTTVKDQATARFGSIELLVLNAGTNLKGSWGDEDYFRKTLETNLFGIINGVNTMLPVVQQVAEAKPTAIVITGSKQGITNPPGNVAYNMSKSAVKTLAEHLSFDLRDTKTGVHLLVPGWTFTGMTGGGETKEKPAGAWAPDQVAEYLYTKMGQNQFYVICPDNDVTEETDKKRMLWSVGDIVQARPPLSRWREDWKEEAAKQIANTSI